MKNIIPAILAFLLLSCTPSKIEKLISDYEQTIGNTKTDLSLKIHELKEVQKITGKDSSNFFKAKVDSTIKILSGDKIKTFKSINGTLDTLVNSYTHILEMDYSDFYAEKLKYWSEIRTKLRINNLKAFKYEIVNDSILAIKYNCTYTIKNPILNNAKQTISKSYYVSKNLSKVLKTSEN